MIEEEIFNLPPLHKRVYDHLMNLRESDDSLYFTLRRYNHGAKIDKGYLFDGDDVSLAVSFWQGWYSPMKIPEISLRFLSNFNKCKLEINVPNSKIKKNFFINIKHYLKFDDYNQEKGHYILHFNDDLTPEECLDQFIYKTKAVIDSQAKSHFKGATGDDNLRGITKTDFNKMLTKTQKHLTKKDALEARINDSSVRTGASGIKGVSIKNYFGIRQVNVGFNNNDWVFVTGKNGSGKTIFLKAIASFLSQKKYYSTQIDPECDIQVKFDTSEEYSHSYNGRNFPISKNLIKGLALYGPSRLEDTGNTISKTNYYDYLEPENAGNSLFNIRNRKLLTLDRQFSFWSRGNDTEKRLFNKRKGAISNLLTTVVSDLINVEFPETEKGKTSYVFNNGISVDWSKLSTGNKSTLGLLGDILVRLYFQQKSILDPADLEGIVIIDEVDLHLHPSGQMKLIKNLANAFPYIQFIVSTHSPIPLLGAPKNSVFIKVENLEGEIAIKRLYKLEEEIEHLLPNTILTSDIFDFNIFEGKSNEEFKNLYVEDNYDDIEKNRAINSRLEIVDTSMFPEKLNEDPPAGFDIEDVNPDDLLDA